MPKSQRFVVEVGETTHEVEVSLDAEGETIATVDGKAFTVRNHGTERTIVRGVGGHTQTAVTLDDASMPRAAAVDGASFGLRVQTRAEHEREQALGTSLGGASSGLLEAPMPGRVVQVLVKVGQQVEVGEPLVIVEAMKMENELTADLAGVVAVIDVEAGQAVDSGQALCTVEPHDDTTPS